MRIGIMLRAYDRPGGIGIYSRNIVKHLLDIDSHNEYVLMYNNREHLGTFGDRDNVDEIFLRPTNALIWDQLLVPGVVKRWDIDLVFHTKFTVPLTTKAKRVMALHGASWFIHPEIYRKWDLSYVRRAMPVYCRKADFLISNSQLTTQDFIEVLGVPEEKIATVHFAAGDQFEPVYDAEVLEQIRNKYRLPNSFILTVTSYDPGKNLGTLLKAFEQCRKEVKVDLVVVGKNCKRYAADFDLTGRGLEDVVYFPD